jgi:hypothetical protein
MHGVFGRIHCLLGYGGGITDTAASDPGGFGMILAVRGLCDATITRRDG